MVWTGDGVSCDLEVSILDPLGDWVRRQRYGRRAQDAILALSRPLRLPKSGQKHSNLKSTSRQTSCQEV